MGVYAAKKWPVVSLRMTDLEDGILVGQSGRSYKARKWRLTDGVVRVVDCAIRNGLRAFWVNGHPSVPYLKGGSRFNKGSHHITFARQHNDKKWVFVLGGEANPPRIEKVTFNKHYWYFVHCTGISYKWEHSGGKNVFVALCDLESLLSRLDEETINHVETASRMPSKRGELLPKTGITSEEQLELAFVEHLRAKPKGTLRMVKVQHRYNGLIPDIILDVNGKALIVVELKLSKASHADLDQLLTYMQLPSLRARISGTFLKGVLIARSFGKDIVSQASASGMAISLYKYGYENALRLKRVSGDSIMEELYLYP